MLTGHASLAAPRTLPDERAARRSLLDQVAWLEADVSSPVAGRGGPRLLSLAELEELRDELAGRVGDAARALSDRAQVEERNRRLIEAMLLDPAAHKWRRVSNEDIGEPGCKSWHVRPRLGPIGVLAGWWRVVISSGCPLAT